MPDRHSRHAGSWYAGSSKELKTQIEELFMSEWGYGIHPKEIKCSSTGKESFLGIVSPHAGYVYSGPVASHGYAEIYKTFDRLDTVFILGPNHSGLGAPISFYPSGTWYNPLGGLEVDSRAIHFAKNYDFGELSKQIGYEQLAHSQEHSIDIQLPFLQYRYGSDFKIVPICLMNQSYPLTVHKLSSFIKAYIEDNPTQNIIIVASSDFSHEHDYDLVMKNDKKMLEFLSQADLNSAESFRRQVHMTMCGFGPVFTLIQTAVNFGSAKVSVLKYSNSTDIVGGRPTGSYTVGYSSILVRCEKLSNK
ncbi:MAG: AmmeMemoRadiSam system protein B [Candidatus Hodarchaeales archaeon]